MTHSSSKRIVFINADKPPKNVSDCVGNYTDGLISRLNLCNASYWNIDVESEQFRTDFLINSASCVVIGALWPLDLNQRFMSLLVSFVQKLIKTDIPLLIYGAAEAIIFDVIGFETELSCRLLGLSEVKLVDKRDIFAFSKIQRWAWRVSEILPVDNSCKVLVVEETSHGEPLLVKHNTLIYSSSAVFGITKTEMLCWIHCFPQYLKGNESIIELNQDDECGLSWLNEFLQMWSYSRENTTH